MKMLFLALVQLMDIGTGPLAGCEASGPVFRLNLNNNYDNYNVGAAARVPAGNPVFFPVGSKSSTGDGLDPTTDHFPDFLHNLLNFKILSIVDSASIFS
jgi:hypothetical protein